MINKITTLNYDITNINNVYCFALDNGKIGIRFCLSDLPNRKYNLEDILE